MTVLEIWEFIQVGGVPALLFLALLGVFRGWWHPGYMLRDMERDRDEWKAIALQNMSALSAVVDEQKERRTPAKPRA